VIIKDSSFITNLISKYFLHILETEEIFLDQITCQNINSMDLRKLSTQKFGGCIRTFNVLFRNINRLIVDNIYSDLTTVGIIIIDEFSNNFSQMNFQVRIFKIIKNLKRL
jgi:hypothetical protein